MSSCKGIWLLFDLDGTITPSPHKAHGQYLPLTKSSCNEPLQNFMREGGRCCVISTAGKRMWMQIYEPLKQVLKELYDKATNKEEEEGRFVLSAFTGATMYYSSGPEVSLVEDKSYRLTKKTTFAPEHVDAIFKTLREIVIKIFTVAASDPTYVQILSKKYHVVFETLLAAREKEGAEKFNETYLSLPNITQHGLYLKESGDALLDVQIVPGIDEKIIAHMNVLAVPMARFGEIFTQEVCSTLKSKFGVTARAQPNSVCIATDNLDKSVPIEYMLQEYKTKNYLREFVPEAAICAGDNVDSVDRPFTGFPQIACISVGTKTLSEDVLRDVNKNCRRLVEVGGEEDGTAKFLVELVAQAQKKQQQDNSSFEENAKKTLDAALNTFEEEKKNSKM